MRHQKAGLKLNRTSSHRIAMFRNMVTSLFKHGRIRTTTVKAKELRRWAERIITLAKRGDLHARRQVLAIIREKVVVHKLFEVVDQRYGAVSGGYTRITKLGRRPGDAAPISLIELLVLEKDKPKKKKVTKKKAKATPQKEPESKKKVEATVKEAEPADQKKKTTKKAAKPAKEKVDKPATKKADKPAAARKKIVTKKDEGTDKKAVKEEVKTTAKAKPAKEKADKPAADRKKTVKQEGEEPEKKVTRKKEKGEAAAKPAAGKKAKPEEKKVESEPTKKTSAPKTTPKTTEKE